MNNLTCYTIKQLQQCYREKLLTPSSFINSSLKNAQDFADLNAFITLTCKEAVEHASESDQLYFIVNKPRVLEGVTVAIKDNFCTKNILTTCASRMLECFVPTYDATVYRKLRCAGACLMGKTNLDEFAMGSGTVNSIYGPTKNVWGDRKKNWRIAGGSSGGSAVAVASGSAIAGIGSDTGGSTRNPASHCGLVGLKPTYGSVSRHGLIPLVNSMDVPGILTRKVEDCVKIFNVINGPDELDSTGIKRLKPVTLTDLDLKKIKVGIPSEYICSNMDEEVIETLKLVEDILKSEGATIQQVSMPNTSISIAVYSILNQCEVASNMAKYDGLEFGLRRNSEVGSTEELYSSSRFEGFSQVVRDRIIAGNYFLLAENYDKYFKAALKLRRLIREDFSKVFSEGIDILLTPTTLSDAPLYCDFIAKDNRDQCANQDYCTQPANMAGVPALSIPIQLSSRGLPLSVQLMGPTCTEELLLNVAKRIEDIVKFPVFTAQ